MSEIRQMVPYADVVVGDDFNSRESFSVFVKKAFDVAEDGTTTLKSPVALKKALDDNEMAILERLKELSASIESVGLLQPIIVREGGPSKKKGRRSYFLIAGERRYRAIGLLREQNSNRFRQIEVKLKKCNATEAAIVAALENLQKESLEPLEVAKQIEQIMTLGKMSQAQAAKAIGKSEPYVSQHLALFRTAPEIREAVSKKVLTATHVRELSTLPHEQQKEVLAVVTEKTAEGQAVSVQDVKDEADKRKKALGLKKTRARKGDAGVEYDKDKIAAAKEVLGDTEIKMRSVSAALEQYGILVARLSNPQTSDATKAVTKIQINASEFFMGARAKL